ncbi:MAG: hypothetical protein HC933_08085 [Pleurocapsa sp. SU_196_0]|nr:hypothetical protein [Pleurocapsa sp. SU_196_0]
MRIQTDESVAVPALIAFGLWAVMIPILSGLLIGQGGIAVIVSKDKLKIHRFYGLIRYSRIYGQITKFEVKIGARGISRVEVYFSAPLVAELPLPQPPVDYIRVNSSYVNLERLVNVLKALNFSN